MIQHVTRATPPDQLARCIEFYGMLGYTPITVPPSIEGRAVWLGHAEGGPDLHLMPTDPSAVGHGDVASVGQSQAASVGHGHVAFVVSPYAEVVERLSEAGYEVEPRREHWGSPRAYVRDPAANLVELMEEAPGGRRQ